MANMLAKHLEQVGARYKLNISVGTKHEYPLNFDMVLKDIKLFFDL